MPTCKRKARQQIVKEFRGEEGLRVERFKKYEWFALLLAYIKRRSIHQHCVLSGSRPCEGVITTTITETFKYY